MPADDVYRPKRGPGYYQTSMSLKEPRKCRKCPAVFKPKSASAKDCEACRKANGNNGRWV